MSRRVDSIDLTADSQGGGLDVIDTRRLHLRPVRPADAGALHALDADPEVMRYVSGGAPTPRATIDDWVIPRAQEQWREHRTGIWAMFARSEPDQFLGWTMLRTPRHSSAGELELSYRLARRAWGAGLATEAASALIAVTFVAADSRISRVFASTHPGNSASRRVMQKLGMHRIDDHRDDPTALPADIEYELHREQWLATRGRGNVRRTAPAEMTA